MLINLSFKTPTYTVSLKWKGNTVNEIDSFQIYQSQIFNIQLDDVYFMKKVYLQAID